MQFTKRNKVAIAIGTGAVVVATGGVALAFWTGTGSGSGSVTAASSSGSLDLTASLTNAVPGGGSAGVYTIPVMATNSGPTSLAVSHVSLANVTPSVSGCTPAVSLATAVAHDPASQVVVPAGTVAPAGVQVGTVTFAFPDSTTVDQSLCKAPNTWTFDLSAS